MAKKPVPPSAPVLHFLGVPEKSDGTWWLKTQSVKVSVAHEFRPGQARSTDKLEKATVHSDDVIEVEFEDGQRLWINGEEYADRFAIGASRGTGAADDQPIPDSLDLLPSGRQSRGLVKWAIKSFKILGIDLEKKTARQIGELVDNRPSATKKLPGLYRCSLKSGAFSLTSVAPKALPVGENMPYLLFLHGTASSTWGSFGGLWHSTRTREREDLYRIYEDRVLAFEHPTFTKSPIDNVVQLAALLPKGITLHVVSHSRGGLIGELLCRGNRYQSKTLRKAPSTSPRKTLAFSEEEIQLLALRNDADISADERKVLEKRYASMREQLRTLNGLFDGKSIAVERFVRVACPALGTTLASRRLDRWFSVVGSIASLSPGAPVADAFSDIADFVAAVIKERTNISELPGLEAMMPESPFIKLVNWPNAKLSGDLTVIAGDIEPDAWWAKLMVFATDRFYEGDHDLVVNTASMYGGARREGNSLASFHKGPGVNHFSYFSNGESAAQIVRALARRNEDLAGFQPLMKPMVDIARALIPRTTEPRPVVFVLPGIMGSELAVDDDKVWVDIPDLMGGGIKKLRMNGAKVTATEPMARYYGDIIEFLGQSHKVVPFPFDWRLPIEQEADRLAKRLQKELSEVKTHGHPVRILAHSMGGLVARAMIARHNALWREVCAQTGARFVMLGTPNGGSHAITELIVGQSSLMSKLALVDFTHSRKALIDIINKFPGVLSMLPVDPREDYFSADTWKQYSKYSRGYWSAPAASDLEKARMFRSILEQGRLDPSSAVYIAGCAAATRAGMRINPDKIDPENPNDPIEFVGTSRGDGRVTWDSGIPDGIPTWYMNAEHGDMPAYRDAFPAILELLQLGNTSLSHVLSKTPPVSRALDELFPMPKEVEQLYPDRDGLAAAALGAGTRRRQRAPRRDMSVRVRVIHGNLVFARYPVAVGHYRGDTIISAEKLLDRELDGELSRRLYVGRYPGALETSAIFTNPRIRMNGRVTPKGAIVIGLGTAGTLTVSGLIKTVHQALIEYVLKQSESPSLAGESEDGLGITALLIGTGAGGFSVSDSVFAILQAVANTNDSLAGAKKLRRIAAVDFIELWQDRAIQAIDSFSNLQRDPDFLGRFNFHSFLVAATGGRKRASFDEAPGWWHRIQILGGGNELGSHQGTLRFSSTTKRARNEVRLLATQRALVDRFVEEAIRTTQDNRQVSRTLFELLLPNELKEAAPDQDNFVLLLDEDAARYPWELLEDPSAPKEARKGDAAFASKDQAPFVIRHGVLRQLELRDFREALRSADGMKSLVIGDPKSRFVELPGAQQEAAAVARIFESTNFQVESLIRPTGEAVINSLYKWPYRILHLAGHGVYRYQPHAGDMCPTCRQILSHEGCMACSRIPQPVTGMIIGDNMFLTPIEVRQMRQVPELVFINCCHLGKMSDASGLDESRLNQRQDYNLMAASVAVEFIRMGVRAVVATGWAVDDRAASTFARTFYDHMLRGARFGEAVKAARKETYESHPGINTWGAYQCYGDPDYRLTRDNSSYSDDADTPTFASASAVITEIENLSAQLETMGARKPTWHLGRLRKIETWLNEVKWANNGSVNLALARAYWEALEYVDALRYFQRALSEDPASVRLKDIEQLANLTSRACVDDWKRKEGGVVANPTGQFKQALKLLDWLQSGHLPNAGGEQSLGAKRTVAERESLRGSTHKRCAWIAEDREAMIGEVGEMETHYAKAWDALRDEPQGAYALLSTIMAGMVRCWLTKSNAKALDGLSKGVATARTLLAQDLKMEPEFWDEIMPVDCDLFDYLLCEKTLQSIPTKLQQEKIGGKKRAIPLSAQGGTDKPDVINRLAVRYQEIRKLGSRRQFASVLDQIEFLATMANRGGKRQVAEDLHRLLVTMAKEL